MIDSAHPAVCSKDLTQTMMEIMMILMTVLRIMLACFRVTMMISFCPAVYITVKTWHVTSCPRTKVCKCVCVLRGGGGWMCVCVCAYACVGVCLSEKK